MLSWKAVHGGERSLLQNSMCSTQKICVIKNVFFLIQRKGPGKYIYRTVKQVVGSEGVGALNVLC